MALHPLAEQRRKPDTTQIDGAPTGRTGTLPTNIPLGMPGPPPPTSTGLPPLPRRTKLPPPPAPAGPIGQGYLTPFDESIPQLFRGIPGTIGGGSVNHDPAAILDKLKEIGGLREQYGLPQPFPDRGRPGPPVAPNRTPAEIESFLRKLMSSGALNATGLMFLLGIARGSRPTNLGNILTGKEASGSGPAPGISRF